MLNSDCKETALNMVGLLSVVSLIHEEIKWNEGSIYVDKSISFMSKYFYVYQQALDYSVYLVFQNVLNAKNSTGDLQILSMDLDAKGSILGGSILLDQEPGTLTFQYALDNG